MTDTFVWERCDSGGGSCVDVDTQTVPEGTVASRAPIAGDVGHTIRVRGYRNGVLVGETGPVGPVVAAGTFFVTPDDLRTRVPDATFTGGSASDFQTFLDSIDGTNKIYGGIQWGVTIDRGLSGNWRLQQAGATKYFFPTNIPNVYVPGGEPIIKGRMVFFNTGPHGTPQNYNFDWLKFDGTHDPTGNTSSWTIGCRNVAFRRFRAYQSDATKGTIGFSPLQGSQFGPGDGFSAEIFKVHDIGQWPVYDANPGAPGNHYSDGYYQHAFYCQANTPLIQNGWIWNVSNRGFQMRGSQAGVYDHAVIDRCGNCMVFGDLAAANNDVSAVIGTNSLMQQHINDWGATAFQAGAGNKLHDSDFHGNFKGDIDPALGSILGANVRHDGTGLDPAYSHAPAGQGASGSSYLSGNPTLVDLRPTNPTISGLGYGAQQMIPF